MTQQINSGIRDDIKVLMQETQELRKKLAMANQNAEQFKKEAAAAQHKMRDMEQVMELIEDGVILPKEASEVMESFSKVGGSDEAKNELIKVLKKASVGKNSPFDNKSASADTEEEFSKSASSDMKSYRKIESIVNSFTKTLDDGMDSDSFMSSKW